MKQNDSTSYIYNKLATKGFQNNESQVVTELPEKDIDSTSYIYKKIVNKSVESNTDNTNIAQNEASKTEATTGNSKPEDSTSYIYWEILQTEETVQQKVVIPENLVQNINNKCETYDSTSYYYLQWNKVLGKENATINRWVKQDEAASLLPDTTSYAYSKIYQNLTKLDSTKTAISETIAQKQTNTTQTTDNYIPEITEVHDWMLGVIILSAIILAWIRLFSKKILGDSIKSIYNYRVSLRIFQDYNTNSNRISAILNVFFHINLGLFLYQLHLILDIFKFDLNSFKNYAIITLGGFALYIFRYITVKTLGAISKQLPVANEYLHSVSIHNKMIGIILFPFVLTVPYIAITNPYTAGFLLKICIFICSIIYIIRFLRLFYIISYKHLSFLYMFLYLCTLEILPILVLVKVFTNLLN